MPRLLPALAIVTLIAVAAGAGLALILNEARRPPPLEASTAQAPKSPGPKENAGGGHSVPETAVHAGGLRRLEPLVTNLAEPADVWIRLEGAVTIAAMSEPDAQMLLASIAADTLAYLRSLALPQIEGAPGLEHLRQDIEERIETRAGDRAKGLVIYTLVLQ